MSKISYMIEVLLKDQASKGVQGLNLELNKLDGAQKGIAGGNKQMAGSFGSLGEMTQSITGRFGGLTGILGKVGGAAAIGAAAYEGFKRTMTASQGTADALENRMNSVKWSVDAFFASLSTGDFSNWRNGIGGMISQMHELSALMDSITDAKLAFGFLQSEIRLDTTEKLTDARDATKSFVERKKALTDYTAAVKQLEAPAQQLVDAEKERVMMRINAKYGGALKEQDLMQFMRTGNNELDPKNADFTGNLFQLDEMRKSWKLSTDSGRKEYQSFFDSVRQQAKELGVNLKDELDLKNQISLRQWRDDDRKEDYARLSEAIANQQGIEAMKKSGIRISNSLLTEEQRITNETAKAAAEAAKEQAKNKGLLGGMDKQIKDLREKMLTTSKEETENIVRQLELLTKKRADLEAMMRVTANMSDASYMEMANMGLMQAPSYKMTQGSSIRTQASEQYSKAFSGWKPGDLPVSNLKFDMNIKPIKNANELLGANANASMQAVDGLTAVGMALSNVSQLTKDGASQWLAWGATLLTAIATAIPAIIAVTGAKEVEAQANVKAMASGAGSSVAGIPIVGPMLAISAIASVMAAFMAIPFANGGLVYGPTLGLVGEYAGASNNPEVIAPLSKLRDMISEEGGGGGVVEFRIQDRYLYGILERYNRRKNRT